MSVEQLWGSKRPARILIADDDAATRELLTAIVEGHGREAVSVADGQAALAAIAANPPDIVLLDLQMPGMDGYEVCRMLRQCARTGQIPVVMVTASDDPMLNRKAYAAGAQACVPKPFRKEGLIAVIEAALAQTRRTKGQVGS